MHRILSAVALALLALDAAAAVNGYVLDEDGKPIAGARVRAIALETTDAQFERLVSPSPEPVALATAQTDEKGAFRLDTKKQPVVSLLIDAPGRAPELDDVADGDTPTYVLRAATTKKGRVTAGGKPVAGASVIVNNAVYARTDENGEYSAPDPSGWVWRIYAIHPDYAVQERLRTGGPLSLDVTLETGSAFTGKVTDPAGRPVANAVIRSGSWPLAKSGEDGAFTIAHLAPSMAKSLRAAIDNRTGSLQGDTIVVRPAGTVAGRVRSTKDDLPIAGMKVSARVDAGARSFSSAVTDAKGAFILHGVPAGEQLSLSHPAFVDSSVDPRVVEGQRVERAFTASPFGRVTGTVVDDEKRPVSGARINHPGRGMTGDPAITAPDGTFSIRLGPSPVTLEASRKPFPNATHGPVRVEPGEVKSGVRIVMPRGKNFEIVLIDTAGVPLPSEPLHITRRIDPDNLYATTTVPCGDANNPLCRTNAEGKFAFNVAEGVYDIRAGGENTIEKELRGQNLSAEASPLTIELERGALVEGRVVWSDGTAVSTPAHITVGGPYSAAGAVVSEGAFSMRNVPAGKLTLIARTLPPVFIESDPVEVTAPASGVVLTIARPGRIEGRVVARDTQQAVRQFTVSTERRGTMRRGSVARAINADDGRFVLEDVAPGTVDVVVIAPGFVRGTTSSVEVPEGKSASVEVSLDRAGTVAGRVTAGGRPVSGASISIGERARRPGDMKQSDANGDYVLDTVPAGTHDLVVRKQGYVARTITVNVSVGKETRGDVELSRGRDVTGRVIDTSGRPVAGAEVMFNPAGGGRGFYSTMQQSDAEGNFRLEGLGEEPYTVTARKSGYVEASAEITPSTPSVTLTLSRGGTLSGRVSGLPPAELAGVEVAVMSRGGSRTTTTVDRTGAFTLNGVADGDVTVTAAVYRPQPRNVQSRVKVVGGTGPFVELDFSSGLVVRGRVTLRGQPVRGSLHLVGAGQTGSGRTGMSQIQPDGSYEVRVPAEGQYRVLVTMQNGPGTMEMETIDVRGEMEHDVEVRGGTLRARVIDTATGAPVAEAIVSVMPAERGRSISASDRTTDSTGWVTFDFLAAARYTLRAQKEGYSGAAQDVSLENGQTLDVDLAVGRAELVLVTVVDAATGQNAQAFVSVLDEAGRSLTGRSPQRDATGAFRLWLGPGTYTLQVMGREYEPVRMPLTVPGLPTVRVEVQRKKE